MGKFLNFLERIWSKGNEIWEVKKRKKEKNVYENWQRFTADDDEFEKILGAMAPGISDDNIGISSDQQHQSFSFLSSFLASSTLLCRLKRRGKKRAIDTHFKTVTKYTQKHTHTQTLIENYKFTRETNIESSTTETVRDETFKKQSFLLFIFLLIVSQALLLVISFHMCARLHVARLCYDQLNSTQSRIQFKSSCSKWKK